jgi:hypothetical protein
MNRAATRMDTGFLAFSCCRKVRMFLRCAAASEVFQLDQHGQSALKLAVQVRFVAGKLLQPVGLQPFANGLIDDSVVVAGLFFLLAAQGKQCSVMKLAKPSASAVYSSSST